ncbi:hypothetical protein DFH06DRAFT_525726 [Mycena polygramma]|nr:hypothetical protein DFH06DRAFT_525726 [Mycena polygramma]
MEDSDTHPLQATVASKVPPGSFYSVQPSTRKVPPVKRLPSMIYFPEPVNRILFQKRFSLAADFGHPDATLGYTYLDEDDQKMAQRWLSRIEDDEATAQKWMENNVFCCKHSKAGFCYCGTEPTAPMPRLPLELLHEICDMTIPPHYMLNASLSCGPNSPWCSSMVTKRSLVLVSRAWYEAGIDLMYRSIFIRRLPAAKALLATLTANLSLGALIRNITVTCYVPRNFRATTRRNLTQILKFCPALTSFSHLPPFSSPTPFPFPALPTTLTSLKFSSYEKFHAVYDTLQQFCPQLEELSLYPKDDEVFDSLELTFPRLCALCLTLTDDVAVQKFNMKWHMPMLSRLTFRTVMRVENLLSAYHNLLAVHGHRICRVLSFSIRVTARRVWTFTRGVSKSGTCSAPSGDSRPMPSRLLLSLC